MEQIIATKKMNNIYKEKGKHMNVSKLKFVASKKWIVFFALAIILIILIGMISFNLVDGVIETVVVFLLFEGPVGFVGVMFLYTYFQTKANLQNIVEACGEEIIKSHIQYGTYAAYADVSTGKRYIYLTDAFIYVRNTYLIDYNQIVLMKTYYSGQKYASGIHLCFYMLNGKVFELYRGLDEKNVEVIMRFCLQKNPRIRIKWNKLDYENYKQNAVVYKKGMVPLPRLTAEQLYAPIYDQNTTGNSQGNTRMQSNSLNNNAQMPMNPAKYTIQMPDNPINKDVEIPYQSTERGIIRDKYKMMKSNGWLVISCTILSDALCIFMLCKSIIEGEAEKSLISLCLAAIAVVTIIMCTIGVVIIRYANKKQRGRGGTVR